MKYVEEVAEEVAFSHFGADLGVRLHQVNVLYDCQKLVADVPLADIQDADDPFQQDCHQQMVVLLVVLAKLLKSLQEFLESFQVGLLRLQIDVEALLEEALAADLQFVGLLDGGEYEVLTLAHFDVLVDCDQPFEILGLTHDDEFLERYFFEAGSIDLLDQIVHRLADIDVGSVAGRHPPLLHQHRYGVLQGIQILRIQFPV